MSVSLDRFVAGSNGEDGGLYDWFFSPAGGEAVAESVRNTGAILLGRQTYGLDGFAGSPYAVEHFVVTHRAPERAAKGEMTFTFVAEGVESAVERANSPLGASPLPTRPPNGGSRRRIHAKADDGEGAPGVLSRAARGRAQRRQGGDRPPHATPVWYAYELGGEVTFFIETQGRRSKKADLGL